MYGLMLLVHITGVLKKYILIEQKYEAKVILLQFHQILIVLYYDIIIDKHMISNEILTKLVYGTDD